MLLLKHLHHDRERALCIVAHWDYDADQEHLMERFRISANAVYPFKHEGNTNFLRFSPATERMAEGILAELEFLRYLQQMGYPALRPILSKTGKELETVDTPAGRYHATAFARVPGKQLDPETMDEQLVFGWGKAMGHLHRLSSGFKPVKHRRKDYQEQLAWMADTLAEHRQEEAARVEHSLVSDWLACLPLDDNFGLIHYDFEPDNVLYDDESLTFYAIDFDDSVYHWYMMDVTTALASYEEDAPGERIEKAREQFIAGYRTEKELPDEWIALLPRFERYRNLYRYVRCLRVTAAAELNENSPEWMVQLYHHLRAGMTRDSKYFGLPM